MSMEDQFDVAAQDRRADAARKARTSPPYVYDRDAVIAAADQERIKGDLAQKAKELEALADQIEKESAEQVEVPELPKVDQEPELAMPKAAPLTAEYVKVGDVIEWEGLKLKVTGFDPDGVALTERVPCCDNPEPHGHEGSVG